MDTRYKLYLILIPVISLSIKWILSYFEFGFHQNILTLVNVKDIHYFPIIYSLSDLNFLPSYIDNIIPEKTIAFPFLPLLIHTLGFKIFGVYSFLILEFIFQISFLLLLFILFKKVLLSKEKSFFFVLFIFFISSFLGILVLFQDLILIKDLNRIFLENIGTRFPRPLISGIVIFYGFYLLIELEKQLSKSFDYIYLLKLSVTISLLTSVYFYYVLNFTIIAFLIIIFSSKLDLIFSKKMMKKFLFSLIIFMISSIPFIIQQSYVEVDHSLRLGAIEIDMDQKIYLIKYFFKSMLNPKFLVLLLIASLLLFYFKKSNNINYKKLVIFYYFIISSMMTFIIFVLFAPKIVSLYHLINIILFSIILYLMLSVFIILTTSKLSLKLLDFFSKKFTLSFLLITIITFNFVLSLNSVDKNKEYVNELIQLEKFLIEKNLDDPKLRIYTNDLTISNLWLLRGNSNLLVSNGFTNSLSNPQIEYNLINTLKAMGISIKQFSSLIFLNMDKVRNEFFLDPFFYSYQANSLHTYSDLKNYSKKMQKIILKTSPLRAQNQVVPEDEKIRLLNLFKNHTVDEDLKPNYAIIKVAKYEGILSKNMYKLIYSSKNYKIFSDNR